MRLALLLLLPLAALLAACEKPDASRTTSPSAKALLGLTTGNTAFAPIEAPPGPVESPAGWVAVLELALFDKLENEDPSLRIVLTLETEPGPSFELWLARDGETVARWNGGTVRPYDGVACFQLLLADDDEAIPLGPGDYTATAVFRAAEGNVLVARMLRVSDTPPALSRAKKAPASGSALFRELLSCPRGS